MPVLRRSETGKSADGKALAHLSKQLLDSLKYQLTVSMLFTKYTDIQLGTVKDIHKGYLARISDWIHHL